MIQGLMNSNTTLVKVKLERQKEGIKIAKFKYNTC